jgi:hypothetical protein
MVRREGWKARGNGQERRRKASSSSNFYSVLRNTYK